MLDNSNDINIIIWKKDKIYRCIMNNCNIKNDTKLDSYMKNLIYEENYKKIMETHENQMIHGTNNRIVLQYVPDNIILEIRVQINVNIPLLSIINHKIRIPLTNIFGILSLINESKMSKTEKHNIKILKQSCYEIIEVANDIIDIINANRGELKLNLEKINLSNLLQECHKIVNNELKKKNLSLQIIIDKDVPDGIIVDITKLKQIIVNLLNNSINNTETGHIIIMTSLHTKNLENPYEYITTEKPYYNIVFMIKDTGIGMDNIIKSHIKSILSTGIDNTYKYGGWGLTISKSLCKLMKGQIWFKTEKNIGTAFYFNIICEGIDI